MLNETYSLDAANNIELGAPLTLLPPTNDYIFKELFRDERHKKMTISFLNAILNGRPVVTDFTVLNPDLPPLIPGNAGARLDLHVKTDQNRYIDIEMQCYEDANLIDRSLHYLSAAEMEYFKRKDVVKKGIVDYSEPRVIGIWILKQNHNRFFADQPSPIHEATFRFHANEFGDHEAEATDKYRAIYLEMPKFKALKPSQLRLLRYWIDFLSDPTSPVNHQADSSIAEAYNALRVLSLDQRVREIYNSLENGRRDQMSLLNTAKKEGIAEEQARVARKLLARHYALEDIVDISGLTAEQAKELMHE